MSINWVPMEPRWHRRLLDRLRAWRWRRHGGLSPRWQEMGAITVDPPEFYLCSLPTGHEGPCKP